MKKNNNNNNAAFSRLRIDVETVCLTCHTFFTLHDITTHLYDKDGLIEVGSGLHLSNTICPNCHLKTLDFDLIAVNPKHSAKEIVNYRVKRHNEIPVEIHTDKIRKFIEQQEKKNNKSKIHGRK